MSNQFGYMCPNCGSQDELYIQAVKYVEVSLEPDGTDDDGGDTEWESTSTARCSNCGWSGTVGDFITPLNEDEQENFADEDWPERFWFPSKGWGITRDCDDLWGTETVVVTALDDDMTHTQLLAAAGEVFSLVTKGKRKYTVINFAEWESLYKGGPSGRT